MKNTDSLPPSLPFEISSDGSEIWDWAGKMGQYIQIQARITELRHEIRICGTRCGDCYKWMHSNECPREKPGTGKHSGYSVGPHMDETICNQYVEKSSTAQRRIDLTKELQQILANV